MSEYQHYIRTDVNGVVIFGFTTGFDSPIPGDLLLPDQDGRHFTIQLTTERGQYKYKVVESVMVARTQQELDAEWNTRPPEPPSEIAKLNLQIIDLWESIIPILP